MADSIRMDGLFSQKNHMRQLAPGFDLATVRSLAETKIAENIKNNDGLMARYKKYYEKWADYRRERVLELVTDCYRVDPKLTPALHSIAQDYLRVNLRIVRPVDLYVNRTAEVNAECLPSIKGNRLIMVLYAGLVARMTPHELLAIMGHEAGHELIGYSSWLPMIDYDMPEFSPLEVAQRKALGCREEIACDRVGLLACQNLSVACMAEFKTATNLPESWMTFDAVLYARHVDDIVRLADIRSIEDFRSHPLGPIRVNALIAFSKSEPFARALGKKEWELSAEDLDKACELMLSVLEPDLTELKSKKEEDAFNNFVLDGALLVVTADGKISPGEIEWYKKKGIGVDAIKRMASDTDFQEKTVERLKDAAFVLNNKLSALGRAEVLRNVCTVAMTSGNIPEQEFEALDYLRCLLELDTDLAGAAKDAAQNDIKEEGNSERPKRRSRRSSKKK